MGTEREITSAVELCRPDGHLNPDAVGWSCGPLHGTRRPHTPLRGWGRTTRWEYWGAGSGVVDGRTVGVQVGGAWTDGTGSTENALVLDGRLHTNGDELAWEYSPADRLAPWRGHDAERARVDLTFTPFHERAARMNLLVVASETHQCFGTWTGWMTDDTGARIPVDGAVGWAEEARNRW